MSDARARTACQDCGAPYGEDGWCDVVIPDEIWNALSASLLCFRCMTKRLEAAGFKDVPVVVTSGPYKDAIEEWRIIGWKHGYEVGKREAAPAQGSAEPVFAKLFSTDLGQILVKLDGCSYDEAPEVRIYFQPLGLGVCSVAMKWEDSDKGWDLAEAAFAKMDESQAKKLVAEQLRNLQPAAPLEGEGHNHPPGVNVNCAQCVEDVKAQASAPAGEKRKSLREMGGLSVTGKSIGDL